MRPGEDARTAIFVCCGCLGVLDYKVVGEAEVHDRLGGDFDVAIARGSCQECSSASACCAADGQADAAGGDAADDHACARHAGDEGSGAFAFALLGADVVVRVEGVLVAAEGHGGEAELEDGAAGEVAAAVGFVDAAGDVGAAGNDLRTVDDDRFDDFAGEAVADMSVLDADVLVDADDELGAGGDGEADRRGRLRWSSRRWCGCRAGGLWRGDGLAAGVNRGDDRVGGVWRGAGRRRGGGGGDLLGLAGYGRLDGGGDGVAVLVDILDLLRGVVEAACALAWSTAFSCLLSHPVSRAAAMRAAPAARRNFVEDEGRERCAIRSPCRKDFPRHLAGRAFLVLARKSQSMLIRVV